LIPALRDNLIAPESELLLITSTIRELIFPEAQFLINDLRTVPLPEASTHRFRRTFEIYSGEFLSIFHYKNITCSLNNQLINCNNALIFIYLYKQEQVMTI